MLPPMIWGRDADGHFGETAPFEMSVDEDNVAAGRLAATIQVVGSVEDLPSAVRAPADLGEAGRLGIGAGTEGRIGNKFG